MYVILLQVLEDAIPEVRSCGDVMYSLNWAKTAAMQLAAEVGHRICHQIIIDYVMSEQLLKLLRVCAEGVFKK